jgi:hypothetical protein
VYSLIVPGGAISISQPTLVDTSAIPGVITSIVTQNESVFAVTGTGGLYAWGRNNIGL